jgi:hypothetical protein
MFFLNDDSSQLNQYVKIKAWRAGIYISKLRRAQGSIPAGKSIVVATISPEAG